MKQLPIFYNCGQAISLSIGDVFSSTSSGDEYLDLDEENGNMTTEGNYLNLLDLRMELCRLEP